MKYPLYIRTDARTSVVVVCLGAILFLGVAQIIGRFIGSLIPLSFTTWLLGGF